MPRPSAPLLALPLLAALPALASLPSRTPAGNDLPGLDEAFREAGRATRRRLARELDLWVDHTRWEDPFRVRTEHYAVTTTHSGRLAREVGQGLEAMLPWFRAVLGSEVSPASSWAVRVFPDLEQYNAFGNEHGAEESSVLGAFHATQAPGRPLALLADPNLVRVKIWATHAATLQFLAEGWTTAPPTWIGRGLGSYFSLFWDFGYGVRNLRGFREQGRYVPLRQLLRENLGAYLQDPDPRFCELGVFFSYLLNYREDTRNGTAEDGSLVPGPFAGYLRLILDGGDPRRHPVHPLLTEGLETLEQEFLAYDFGV